MTRAEKRSIIEYANALTNEQLEGAYYDAVFDSLGSQVEEMYERGYDMADIREREQHEKYLSQKADILAELCEKRGIELWVREK